MNERSDDLGPRLRLRARLDHFVERLVEDLAAVGIAGAVLLHGANVDLGGTDDLGPGHGDGKEMGVPEGDVGRGNCLECGVRSAECGVLERECWCPLGPNRR